MWLGAHAHFDGVRWAEVAPPPGRVERVAAAPGAAFAATAEGGVYGYDGAAWRPVLDLGPVVSTFGQTGGAGWEVGLGGVLRREGPGWSIATRARAPFESVAVKAFGPSATDVWVVELDGATELAHWDGARWARVAAPAAISTGAATADRVWLVGAGATRAYERAADGTWRPVQAFGNDGVWDLWASGTGALALTSRPSSTGQGLQVLWRWDGDAWTAVWRGTRALPGGWVIAATSTDDAWLALTAPSPGDGFGHADLVHWDGRALRIVGDLRAAAGRVGAAVAPGELWFTDGEELRGALTTTLRRATGEGIQPEPVATIPARVRALWSDAGGVWALSDRGAIWEAREGCP